MIRVRHRNPCVEKHHWHGTVLADYGTFVDIEWDEFPVGSAREHKHPYIQNRDRTEISSPDRLPWSVLEKLKPEIKVVSLMNDRDATKRPGAVYIGREMQGWLTASPLANPFKVGRDGDRHQVCELYLEQCLDPALERRKGAIWGELWALADRVRNGESLSLVCWCQPERCHGFDIAAAIKFLAAKEPDFYDW